MGRIVIFRACGDRLERLPVEADTLDEATLRTGHGVYSVLRVYPGGRVLRLDRHLDRMRRSAAVLDAPYPLADGWLRAALRRAVQAGGLEAPRLRLTVPFDAPDSALIALEPFSPPPAALYEQGVRVALVEAHRDSPRAKNSRFIEQRQRIEAARAAGVYETLLCSDGLLLEGTSSNFYGLLDGVLYTAGEGVLEGVARSILLEVAPAVLPLGLTAVRCADAPRLSEAMLTSASRGIVPIVQIGEAVIGGGVPGPIYRALRERYDALVERELEPL